MISVRSIFNPFNFSIILVQNLDNILEGFSISGFNYCYGGGIRTGFDVDFHDESRY